MKKIIFLLLYLITTCNVFSQSAVDIDTFNVWMVKANNFANKEMKNNTQGKDKRVTQKFFNCF